MINAIREIRAIGVITTIKAIRVIKAISETNLNYHKFKLSVKSQLPSLSDDNVLLDQRTGTGAEK